MLKYHPYKSNKPGKKHYIITESNKKVYFGAAGMSDFTIHNDEQSRWPSEQPEGVDRFHFFRLCLGFFKVFYRVQTCKTSNGTSIIDGYN
jgi:hypothetical protein